jgi:hypothetical protein
LGLNGLQYLSLLRRRIRSNISPTGSFRRRMLKARDRARVGRACVFDVTGKALKVRGAAIGMTPLVTVTPRPEREFAPISIS